MTALLLHELGHIIAYSFFALLILAGAKNYCTYKNFLIGLVVTILIDLDHFVDYFLYTGIGFNISDFLAGAYFDSSQRVIVPLHSWEIVALLLIAFMILKDNQKYSFILFIALGLGVHMFFDVIYYGFNWDVYFLSVRALNNFSILVFVP